MFHRNYGWQILRNADDNASGAGDAGAASGGDGATPAGGNSSTGTSPVSPDGNEGEKPTLTQTQVDSMLSNRIKRERENWLKEAGVDSLENLTAILQANKDAEEAQKTEAQKLSDQLKAEQEQRLSLEQQLADMKLAGINDKRDSAIKRLAQAANAVDVEDVLLNVHKSADALASLVNDDGVVDEVAIKAAVEKVRTDKPHLFGKNVPSTPSNRAGNAPNPDDKQLKQAMQSNLNRARRR